MSKFIPIYSKKHQNQQLSDSTSLQISFNKNQRFDQNQELYKSRQQQALQIYNQHNNLPQTSNIRYSYIQPLHENTNEQYQKIKQSNFLNKVESHNFLHEKIFQKQLNLSNYPKTNQSFQDGLQYNVGQQNIIQRKDQIKNPGIKQDTFQSQIDRQLNNKYDQYNYKGYLNQKDDANTSLYIPKIEKTYDQYKYQEKPILGSSNKFNSFQNQIYTSKLENNNLQQTLKSFQEYDKKNQNIDFKYIPENLILKRPDEAFIDKGQSLYNSQNSGPFKNDLNEKINRHELFAKDDKIFEKKPSPIKPHELYKSPYNGLKFNEIGNNQQNYQNDQQILVSHLSMNYNYQQDYDLDNELNYKQQNDMRGSWYQKSRYKYYQNYNDLKKEMKKEVSIFQNPVEKFQSKYQENLEKKQQYDQQIGGLENPQMSRVQNLSVSQINLNNSQSYGNTLEQSKLNLYKSQNLQFSKSKYDGYNLGVSQFLEQNVNNSTINYGINGDISDVNKYQLEIPTNFGRTVNLEDKDYSQLTQLCFSAFNHLPEQPENHQEFAFVQKDLAFYEMEVEKLRLQLLGRNDFNSETIFQEFDIDEENHIDYQELLIGFKKFGIKPHPSHLFFLIIRYSRDGDFTISSDEFKRFFYPESLTEKEIQEREKVKGIQQIGQQTKNIITQLLKMLLNEEAAAEHYRNYLKDNKINLKKIYHQINQTKKQDLNTEMDRYQYSDFLLYNGLYLRSKEVSLIFTRFDRNNNGKINWKEFLFELTPQQPLYEKYLSFAKNNPNYKQSLKKKNIQNDEIQKQKKVQFQQPQIDEQQTKNYNQEQINNENQQNLQQQQNFTQNDHQANNQQNQNFYSEEQTYYDQKQIQQQEQEQQQQYIQEMKERDIQERRQQQMKEQQQLQQQQHEEQERIRQEIEYQKQQKLMQQQQEQQQQQEYEQQQQQQLEQQELQIQQQRQRNEQLQLERQRQEEEEYVRQQQIKIQQQEEEEDKLRQQNDIEEQRKILEQFENQNKKQGKNEDKQGFDEWDSKQKKQQNEENGGFGDWGETETQKNKNNDFGDFGNFGNEEFGNQDNAFSNFEAFEREGAQNQQQQWGNNFDDF
ncbi:hypothetical protein PPERSA_07477 [Pseudocohnilembus persalinus]|uniref:EF-hand domain-containing protein n=1 Tax=Pseudocohnilembus persalinus TaxID=266149 RepID=A0A0V0R2B4_PSEPJ|nr:hypothetical protein PPERSA_07477 [Pseudocohnilembus persalinus]|eukprot:KRX08665.1 hypothetical protein PPERSA_07477 [Pseudocohnilembus persalinus]